MKIQQRRFRQLVGISLPYLVVFFLIVIVALMTYQARVRAVSINYWMTGTPVLVSSSAVEINLHQATNQPGCEYQTIETRSKYAGILYTNESLACVVKGKYLRLAHTQDGIFVSFGSDRYYYRFHTDNTGLPRHLVRLAPGTDRIGFVRDTFPKKIMVYDRFSTRLTLDKHSLRYHMTDWEERLFPESTEEEQSGTYVGFSNNGRYIVYQSRDDWPGVKVYLVRVDLDTGERKQFGYLPYSYFASPLPNPHYSISNDGTLVVAGGIDMLSIWSLDQECLVDVSETIPEELCPSRSITAEEFNEASDPQGHSRTYGVTFNDEATELSFLYQASTEEKMKRIVLRNTGPIELVSRLDYLALGDSYSSGEGDPERDKRTNKKYYRQWTDQEENKELNQPREKCHVSTRSYPYVLAKGMNLGEPLNSSLTRWHSVACSGATTKDADADQTTNYEGQGKGRDRLWSDSTVPRLNGYPVTQFKEQALNEFVPGRHKQIEFVKKYRPNVITFTLGGNDLGFSEKLTSCIIPGTCKIATPSGRGDLAKEIRDQYDRLVSFYEEIYEASGRMAKIFVLGYPQFINSNLDAQCQPNKGDLNIEERKAIESSISYFNDVIEQATLSVGVKYIDIEYSLENGRLCDAGQTYMTGLSFAGGNEIQESFHPNSKGNYQIAMSVWEQLENKSLLDYDICPVSDENICPDLNATKESIAIPPYFQVPEPGYEIEYVSDLTYGNVQKGQIIPAIRSAYTFSPDSTVEFTLFSDPISLGKFPVNKDGSVNVNLQIPDSVLAGYHTLVVDGSTYSGEPIRYEQIILVHGSDLNDIDDDGVADNLQACGPFIEASGSDADLDGIDDACDPQISSNPELYRWRRGYMGRTYNGVPEDESQIYIERNIWAGARTGISGDFDPDGDGWATIGASRYDQLGGLSIEDIVTLVELETLGSGTELNPFYPVIYIRPNTEQCKALRPTSMSKVLENELRTLSVAEISSDKCPQEFPKSSPPQAVPNKPKNLIVLDKLKGILQIMKKKPYDMVNDILAEIRTFIEQLRR